MHVCDSCRYQSIGAGCTEQSVTEILEYNNRGPVGRAGPGEGGGYPGEVLTKVKLRRFVGGKFAQEGILL